MANGFANLRQNVLNQTQHPRPSNPNTNQSPIACRLCNQTFPSTQALIAHVDSHMASEEVAIRRLYSPQQFASSSPHHFSPPTPQPSVMGNGRTFQSPSQPMGMPRRSPLFNALSQVGPSQPTRPMASPHARNFFVPNDGTKAFLMQLDKPIKRIDFIDLVNLDDDNPNVQPLDLELRL